MTKAKTADYGNESISQLKGADRVRKRPGVIFGSDGLGGCEHAVFEILSNAIDEAREGYGKEIVLTSYSDGSIEVEDFGRGCPLDWNPNEKRYNWELVFCELYAGGKYENTDGGDYEYSLGLNGLGACATQYSAEYMTVDSYSGGMKRSTLAYGMPRNAMVPSCSTPLTSPAPVLTTIGSSGVQAQRAPRSAAAAKISLFILFSLFTKIAKNKL